VGVEIDDVHFSSPEKFKALYEITFAFHRAANVESGMKWNQHDIYALVRRNPKKFSTASTNAPRGDSYRQGISLECYRLKKSKLSAFYERFKPLR